MAVARSSASPAAPVGSYRPQLSAAQAGRSASAKDAAIFYFEEPVLKVVAHVAALRAAIPVGRLRLDIRTMNLAIAKRALL